MLRTRTTVRENRFTVLLSDDERLELDRAAARAGVDRATLIRLRVFGGGDHLAATTSHVPAMAHSRLPSAAGSAAR